MSKDSEGPTITFSFDHPDPRQHQSGDAEPHSEELRIRTYINPGEMFGTDADGNRGVWQPAYLTDNTDWDEVKKCEECGHVYTDEERAEMAEKADKLCADYTWEEDDDTGYKPDYED